MKFSKQAPYIKNRIAKLSKFGQISVQTSLHSFLEDSMRIKKGLELVSRRHFFLNFLMKKISFVALHKLAKIRYKTLFTLQVMQ